MIAAYALALLMATQQPNCTTELTAHGQHSECVYDLVHPTDTMYIQGYGATPQVEPIDVPAIEKIKAVQCSPPFLEDGARNMTCAGWLKNSRVSCADRSRILLHSEDGKYWCHKPQPAVTSYDYSLPALNCGPVLIWPMDDLTDSSKQEVWMCQLPTTTNTKEITK